MSNLETVSQGTKDEEARAHRCVMRCRHLVMMPSGATYELGTVAVASLEYWLCAPLLSSVVTT